MINKIIFQVLYYTTKVGYSYTCQTVDYSDNYNELQVSRLQQPWHVN